MWLEWEGDSEVETVAAGLHNLEGLAAAVAMTGLKLVERTVAEGLRKLDAWAVATRLNLNDLERVVAARFCELAKATILNLADFDRAVATRLCELTMEAIFCEEVVAEVLSLAVLERAAAGLCELTMVARLREL